MPYRLNPLALVQDKRVSIHRVLDRNDITGLRDIAGRKESQDHGAPSLTYYRDDVYDILLLQDQIKQIYETSWLKNSVTFEEMEFGFLMHEIAHIRYDTFTGAQERDKLISTIDNLLDDTRIEYQLTIEFPLFARYVQYAVRGFGASYHVVNIENQLAFDKVNEIELALSSLFLLARFGVVENESTRTREWLSFALPYVLASRRGSRETVGTAAVLLANYLYASTGTERMDEWNDIDIMVDAIPLSRKKLDELQNGERAIDVARIDNGKMPGTDGTPEIHIDNGAFYRQTLERHAETIERLRREFKRHLFGYRWSPTYEGDIDIKRQQEAYLASFSHDPEPVFQQWRRTQPDLEVVLVRDVSGSISDFRDQYAEVTTCILASLEKLVGIRSALIDFNVDYKIRKSFTDALDVTEIYPKPGGGTDVLPALTHLQTLFTWKSRMRLAIIVTDGGFLAPKKVRDSLHRLREKCGVFPVLIGVENDAMLTAFQDDFPCRMTTVRALPVTINELLLAATTWRVE